jgi:hypothetical protein
VLHARILTGLSSKAFIANQADFFPHRTLATSSACACALSDGFVNLLNASASVGTYFESSSLSLSCFGAIPLADANSFSPSFVFGLEPAFAAAMVFQNLFTGRDMQTQGL